MPRLRHKGAGSQVPSTNWWPRPSPQDKSCARGCARQCALRQGRVEGCCPAHCIIHPQCRRLVGRLLHFVVGDGEGLVLRHGIGNLSGAGVQGGELRQSVLGHGHKKR